MTAVGVREGRIQASSHRQRSDALCSSALRLEAYASGALTSLRILPSRRSNSTGLVSNSSHPAASAFSRSPASAWADRPMTGMWLALQTPCRFPAVDDRHLQVHQDKVRPLGSRNLASFFAILGD